MTVLYGAPRRFMIALIVNGQLYGTCKHIIGYITATKVASKGKGRKKFDGMHLFKIKFLLR